jgi:mannose-6-phosphate isomerase-like protein (cupin superfamily)
MSTDSPGGQAHDQRAQVELVVAFDSLPQTKHAHEFVGADHGQVPFSLILVHAPPGAGPRLHRHPYAEVFVVESGEATFQLGDDQVVVTAGHVVVGPPDVPHGFTNTGTGELRLIAIHGASEFFTEWIAAADQAWTSDPGATQ